MIVVTTDSIVGQKIIGARGQVFGLAVRGRGLGGNIMAGLAALDAETMTEYTDSLVEARDEAIVRMVARATELGANAIVRLRFDSAPVSHDLTEIVAYGTAVVVESDELPTH